MSAFMLLILASSWEHFFGVFRPLAFRDNSFRERLEVLGFCDVLLIVDVRSSSHLYWCREVRDIGGGRGVVGLDVWIGEVEWV